MWFIDYLYFIVDEDQYKVFYGLELEHHESCIMSSHILYADNKDRFQVWNSK